MAGKFCYTTALADGCFADHHSFVEGIVRGYRNTLLTGQNYNNLTQCETIDGPSNLYVATQTLD